jgi:O-antigen ligase
MGKQRRKSTQGRVAFAALAMAIVLAPVSGGSANIFMLPVLSVLVGTAYSFSLFAAKNSGRKYPVLGLAFALFGLGLLSLFQVLPLPNFLLAVFSPKAHELRSFVSSGVKFAPLSYEPGITAREATELFLCGLVAVVAYERTRARQTSFRVIGIILSGVVACILVGAIHRIGHFEEMLGFVSSSLPAHRLLTTFVNPNHAAGFTAWGAIIALGLALEEPRRHIRAAFGTLALLCAGTSVLCTSRGGLAMLAFGLILFIAIYWTKRRRARQSVNGAWLSLILLLPLFVGFWARERLVREFASTPENLIGLEGKLSAIQGAQNMITDHPWFGIGRGAYISLFSHYKTTAHQYTYTHPENIVIQMVTDWGVIIGTLAVLGLTFLLVQRIRKATAISELAALVGLAALCLQNLVDFSLELLGAALPAAALLGAVHFAKAKSLKLDLSRAWIFSLCLSLPLGLLGFSCYLAFQQGQLNVDLQTLAEKSDASIAKRHPANAVVAARMSFHAETAQPPKIREALAWANRALYLAPSYAEAHLVAGRLLIKTGHRKQGFEEIRSAWKLAHDHKHPAYFAQILHLARDTEEILETIPRRDEALDVLDERQLAIFAYWLSGQKKAEIARKLLAALPPLESIEDPDALLQIAWAGLRTQTSSLALDALRLRRRVTGNALDGIDLEVQIWRARRNWDRALECVERGIETPDRKKQTQRLRQAIGLALRTNQPERADKHLQVLAQRMSPTPGNQIDLLSLKTRLALKRRKDGEALKYLDQGINLAPSHLGLRLKRARLFLRTKRLRSAKNDIDFILRMEAKNSAALALAKQLQKRL